MRINKIKRHNMYKIGSYTAEDSMSELICNHYPILMVVNRFGISLGIGDKTIAEVCLMCNVHTETFLAVVNLVVTGKAQLTNTQNTEQTIEALLVYLTNSHEYFVSFRLNEIRTKLLGAIQHNQSDLNNIIKQYFDHYVEEVKQHMKHEEKTVFPYIHKLISTKETPKNYNIDLFSKQHTNIENKLSELKNIIIKYYDTDSTNQLTSALYDIFDCAQDLSSHNDVENKLLVPMVKQYEKMLTQNATTNE